MFVTIHFSVIPNECALGSDLAHPFEKNIQVTQASIQMNGKLE